MHQALLLIWISISRMQLNSTSHSSRSLFDRNLLLCSLGIILNLSASDSPITQDPRLQTHYRSMVATHQFAATWIRFNIAYAASQLACFCASAGPKHHAALHHLMEYLVCYPSFKLEYSKKSCNSMGLNGFCDADWATSDTRHSTTGFIFCYNGAPIQWKTKL
jgi:hypothetical protein